MTIQELGILLNKRGKKMAISHSRGQYHAYAFDKADPDNKRLAAYGRGDEIDQAIESLVEKVQ